MTKVRAIQRYKLPNFDLINGNGIVERIQLLVDPVEIADYQDPVESKKSPGIHKSVRISALQAAQKLRWIFKNGR